MKFMSLTAILMACMFAGNALAHDGDAYETPVICAANNPNVCAHMHSLNPDSPEDYNDTTPVTLLLHIEKTPQGKLAQIQSIALYMDMNPTPNSHFNKDMHSPPLSWTSAGKNMFKITGAYFSMPGMGQDRIGWFVEAKFTIDNVPYVLDIPFDGVN